MTAILPKATDTKPSEDWRTGLVLPRDHPHHVYGKTALSQQEWRALGHKLDDKGIRFVAVYTSFIRGTRTASQEVTHAKALRYFTDGAKVVDMIAALRGSASTLARVSVHRVDEWRGNGSAP
jgi:hypothetical protein